MDEQLFHAEVSRLSRRLGEFHRHHDADRASTGLLGAILEELSRGVTDLGAAERAFHAKSDAAASALAQAAQLRRRYEQLFDNAPVAYAVTDPHGIIERGNRVFHELLERRRPALCGKPLRLLAVPQHRDEIDRLLASAVSGRSAQGDISLRSVRSNYPLVCQARVAPSRGGDGVLWIIGALPQRAAGEAACLEAHGDELLALLGHELRNPLAPCLVAGALIESGDADVVRRRRAVATIQRQVRQMARLLDDLSETVGARGQLVLHRTPSSVQTLIDRALLPAVESVRERIAQRHHTLYLELAPNAASPGYLEVDVSRLQQVLVNVLDNAVKYTPDGGSVRVGLTVTQRAVEIRITDSGVGLERDEPGQLFEAFSQLEPGAAVAQRAGLGLGLTLVERIVKQHGGAVNAQSAGRNRGTTITLRLPLKPGELPQAPRRAQQSRPLAMRVVVLDGDADTVEALAVALDASGHIAVGCRSLEDAATQIAAVRPHVVLVDLGSVPAPAGSAVAALRGAYRHARLIAFGNQSGADPVHRSRAAGFERYLPKPLGLRDLDAALADAPD